MEKEKERTKKYEISIRSKILKGKEYIEARISLNFGIDCKRRLAKGGKTDEEAILNLLDEYLNFIDTSYKNGLIHAKIDDIVSQRLVKSLNDLNMISAGITQKALEIVNRVNYINSCILNTIVPPSNVIPLTNPNTFQATLPAFLNNYATHHNKQNEVNTIINTKIEKCIIEDLACEWHKYRLSLCKKTPDNPKPLSQTTVDTNFRRLRDDILPYFKKHKILYLSQVTDTIVDNLLKSITSQNSKHKSYVVLNMLFKYAIKHNKATINIMEKVEKPPEKIITGEEDNVENYIETDRQNIWLNLFEKENTDMSLLFETMLLTGLRPEESCGLKWKALKLIDENHGDLIVNNAHKSFNKYNEDGTKVIGHYRTDDKLKTPESYRTIPLNPRLIDNLLKHKQYQQALFKKSKAIKSQHRKWSEEEYIFIGRNYRPYVAETLSYGMWKFRNKYNLEYVTPYGLRHSFATYCSEQGMEEIVLMKLMGHSNFETTQKYYIKVSDKRKRLAMQEAYKVVFFERKAS